MRDRLKKQKAMAKIETFRQLRDALNKIEESELDSDLVVVDAIDEYVPVKFRIGKEQEDDVLNKGHLFLMLDTHILDES